MANNTFTLVQTVTVGAGGAASIEFTGVPQDATDLAIVLSGRINGSGVRPLYVQFNNDSNTIYANKSLYGNSSSAGSVAQDTGGFGFLLFNFAENPNNSTSNTFSNGTIYIPNYAGSNKKIVSFENVVEYNTSEGYQWVGAGLFDSTSAITSVKLYSAQNWLQYSTASLYTVKKASALTAKATGGTITSGADGYVYHTFTSSGTFTPTTALTADVLVVAGGGAGGSRSTSSGDQWGTGGGGAGGLVYAGSQSLSATAYTVTVGAGGTGSSGTSGSNSSFTGLTTAVGGGYGGSYNTNAAGATGGSGGGAVSGGNPGSAGTSGQGYAGGSSYGSTSSNMVAGGGGGASAVGGNVVTNTNAGDGGAGLQYFGTYYAGGGGGGNYGAVRAGYGGTGGGGAGGKNASGTAGTVNLGGGGGGSGSYTGNAGNGGSGVVVVRYLG